MNSSHINQPRRRRHVTVCEPLENRLLLAVINWLPGVSGDFHDPTKWSTGTVPGPIDDAVIGDVGAQTITLTQPATVKSLAFENRTGVATLKASATLTVSLESSIGAAAGSAVGSIFQTSSTIDARPGFPGSVKITGLGELHLLDGATVDAQLTNNGFIRVMGDAAINRQFAQWGELHISGSHAYGDARLTLPNGLTNSGRLWLDGPADTAAAIRIAQGQLVNRNQITSTATPAAGTAMERKIEGALLNERTLTVAAPLRLRGGNHSNPSRATIDLQSDLTIEQTATGTFTTAGAIRFAAPVGGNARLQVDGGTFNNNASDMRKNSLSGDGSIVFNKATVNATQFPAYTPVQLIINQSTVNANIAIQVPVVIEINNSYVRGITSHHKVIIRGDTTVVGYGGTSESHFLLEDDPILGDARLTVNYGPDSWFHNQGTLELDTRSALAFDSNVQFTWKTIVKIGPDSEESVPRFTVAGEIGNPLGGSFEIRTEPGFEPPQDYVAQLVHGGTITGSLPYVSGTTPGGRPFKLRRDEDRLAVAVAPEAPSTPDLTSGSDTGVSATDDITRDDTPTFSGTAVPGMTVNIVQYNGTAPLATTVAGDDGAYTVTLDQPLSQGSHSIRAETVDLDGDTNASPFMTFRLDRTPPRLTAMGPASPAAPLFYSNSVTLIFDERTVGFDVVDVRLSYEGEPFLPTEQAYVEQVMEGVNSLLRLHDTAPELGSYAATVAGATAGITDLAGNAWTGNGSATWIERTVVDTHDDDHVRVVRDLAHPQRAHVFVNDQSVPARSFDVTRIPSLQLINGNGTDTFTIDFTHGNPGQSIELNAPNETVVIRGLYSLAPVVFKQTEFTVGDFRVKHGGTKAVMVAPDETLRVGGLTFEGNAKFDLGGSSLVIQHDDQFERESGLKAATAAIASARNTAPARWTGPGLTSSAAAADPLTTLAVGVLGDDIVVKHTYNGDANLDGRINADDYFRIDQGFLAQPPDPLFSQGDFNYDGKINADDYFLIDQAFLGQGAPLTGSADPSPLAPAPAPQRATTSVSADDPLPRRTTRRVRPPSLF